jgi:lipopolysaccharide transport system ATP-binding protein
VSPGKEDFWALKDVNFEVQHGEVMGVIGRNGAGKSTLLKILSRITSPSTGTVHLQGRVASLLEVGTGFHPELTGRENIFLNGAILGMTRKEIGKKFDEIVAFAEVEKFIDTPVKRYSSGMYVRLAFAVAAHLEPETLVVDEVLAVGDLAFQKKCLNKMEDVSGEGRTVLFVSHNMASIKRLCRSALLLESGHIRALGQPQDVISTYYSDVMSSDASVKFEPCDHRVRSPLQISAVELVDDHGNLVPHVYADQTTNLRLTIALTGPVRRARVGIEIHREGALVTNSHSAPEDFDGSLASCALTCQIPGGALMPGFFDIHVGAHDPDTGQGLDWIPEACTLHVLDIPSGEASQSDSRDRGLVRLRTTWIRT